MSNGSWVVLDEYSFDGGETVEYRHPRTCKTRKTAEVRAWQLACLNHGEVGFVRCVVRPADRISVSLNAVTDAVSDLDRLRRLHDVTADHLRKARRELATLRYDLEEAEEVLQLWHGSSSRYDVSRTPEHYRGDGLVTCSRALESAASQQGVSELPNLAFYWWGCAFKYLWRMWSKGNPESDAKKACDCIRKAVHAWRAQP